MYRIVREENLLSNRVQYFIEEYRGWFSKKWTRNLTGYSGGVLGGQTLGGAKAKLKVLKSREFITEEIVYNEV